MSKKYLTVYNLDFEKDWVLKNAFDIIETQEINTVYQLEFSIPKNDQDMEHCQPYWYVRYGDDGQLYRFTEQVKTNANESTITYHCEHVIATLSDDIMFQGPYIKGNNGTYTNQVLNYILEMQTKRKGVFPWKLGICQPPRQFEYSWENENLLAALFSVPNCFATPYIWTYNTSSYPWTVNLLDINEDADPDFYLMAKKNILQSSESSSNLEICTRLYGLGEGEGINQLTIKSVNNGCPYIQSSPEKIAEYGIVSRIFVDRRYQYPETLKARMETLLHELETPSMKREFDIVDLHDISPDDMYKAEVGRICLLKDDNTKVYITKTVKNWTVPGDMKITIATKATDISTSIADLADRQRIEQVYSQGASQVYSFNFSGNATDQYPLNGYVYFPNDLKYLNEVKLKVKLDPFRSYSKAKSALFDGGTLSTKEGEGGKQNVTTTGEDGGVTGVTTTGEDGGVTGVTTTGEDGGVTDVTTTGKDGGVTDVTTTGEDGGVTDVTTTGKDGGVEGCSTIAGGGVNTVTGEGGGQEGETSIASGGSGISLSGVTIDVNLNINNTEDANWERTPYTENKDLDIKVTNNQGQHQHYIDSNSRVASVTPLESYDYKHTHYFSEDGVKTAYTEYGGGAHSHEAYVDNQGETGHHHDIPRWTLKHKHGISGNCSGKVNVNNSEGNGQTGFAHSHNFKIKSHTHDFSTPDHQHTFNTPNHQHTFNTPDHQHTFNTPDHQHTFNTPNHQHTFNTPNHQHTFNTPNHTHTMTIGKHGHDIEPGIFTTGNPKTADLLIGGVKKATITQTETELDITQYLQQGGKVPRGQWIQISVKPTGKAPDNMAYISVFGNVFAFIQSYTGGNF